MDISIRPGLNIKHKQSVVRQYPDQMVYHPISVYIIHNVPLGPWKKRACRGPATITRLPTLFFNQFFHHIKLLQPYDVCRHQPAPFYVPDCYICEH